MIHIQAGAGDKKHQYQFHFGTGNSLALMLAHLNLTAFDSFTTFMDSVFLI